MQKPKQRAIMLAVFDIGKLQLLIGFWVGFIMLGLGSQTKINEPKSVQLINNSVELLV